MTKIRKKKVLTDRQVKNAKSRAKSAKRRAQSAEIEAQNAEMEAQIAEIDASYEEQLAEMEAQRAEMETQRKAQIAAIRAQYERVAAPPAPTYAPTYAPTADDTIAQLNAQMETIQRQLAQLQGAAPASGIGVGTPTDNAGASGSRSETFPAKSGAPEVRSLKPEARSQLAKPVITSVFAINPTTIVINWLPVEGAESYNLRIGTNEDVTPYLLNTTCSASAISLTITGLDPNTQYWVAMRTHAVSPDTNSNYTYYGPVTTLSTTPPGVVGDLQQWLIEQQAANARYLALLPDIDGYVLSPAERRRLRGAGVRRYGYIDQVSDISSEYPQFWPPFVTDANGNDGSEQMKELLREIEVLRNLLIAFRNAEQNIEDMLLQAGSDAFRLANYYYRNVRDAAANNVQDAANVFDIIRMFWKRVRQTTGEPTQIQAIRDFKGVLRGKREGTVAATNESDTVVKGAKSVIDETTSVKKHGGMKASQSGEATGNRNVRYSGTVYDEYDGPWNDDDDDDV